MQKEFILYGTSACHLCEEAEKTIHSISEMMNISYSKMDIVEDDILLQRYSLLIPVVHCTETQNELCWPFNEIALKTFINGQ